MKRLIRSLGLAWACTLSLLPAAAAPVSSTYDFSRAHEFLGFGTQVWLGQKNTAESTQMLRDLNARFVRVSLNPKITFDQLQPGMSVAQVLAVLDRNDSAEQRERFQAFARQMRELNIRPVIIYWRMPKPWTVNKDRRAGSRAESSLVNPARIGDYANLITAQMLYAKRHGVLPAAVELTNEPQGAWDTKYEREEYATLVAQARAAMDAQGLNDWRIAGPGTGIRNFDHYVGGLIPKDVVRSLGYISAHVYQSPAMLADSATPGVASFLGRGKFGPILITEFGVKKHNDDHEDAGEDLDVTTPAYALAAAAEGVMLLGHGAGGLIYWQLQDFNWSKKPHGLLGEDGRRRPVAQAFQALFGQVPAGVRVVGASTLQAQLPSVALQGQGQSFLMVVNLSGQVQDWQARLQGGSGQCQQLVAVHGYRADGRHLEALRELSVKDCQLRAQVQPGAVATVVLK